MDLRFLGRDLGLWWISVGIWVGVCGVLVGCLWGLSGLYWVVLDWVVLGRWVWLYHLIAMSFLLFFFSEVEVFFFYIFFCKV